MNESEIFSVSQLLIHKRGHISGLHTNFHVVVKLDKFPTTC